MHHYHRCCLAVPVGSTVSRASKERSLTCKVAAAASACQKGQGRAQISTARRTGATRFGELAPSAGIPAVAGDELTLQAQTLGHQRLTLGSCAEIAPRPACISEGATRRSGTYGATYNLLPEICAVGRLVCRTQLRAALGCANL